MSEAPNGRFSIGTIGPEPSGATPLEDEDLQGLILDFVSTRAELDRVEFENISIALPWAIRRSRSLGPAGVLDYGFFVELHQRMFGEVWRWAGTIRRRLSNIGVDPSLIVNDSRNAIDDARFWHDNNVFAIDERAARIHARLVSVHPFPNGNGRCTRLFADLYLSAVGQPTFTWGRSRLDAQGASREAYLGALLKAIKEDEFFDLVAFARS